MATLPALPSEADAALARETSRILASHLLDSDPAQLRIQADETTVTIPVSAARLLVDILEEMARGNAVTLIPIHAELTTQQAADLLNISPAFTDPTARREESAIPSRRYASTGQLRKLDEV